MPIRLTSSPSNRSCHPSRCQILAATVIPSIASRRLIPPSCASSNFSKTSHPAFSPPRSILVQLLLFGHIETESTLIVQERSCARTCLLLLLVTIKHEYAETSLSWILSLLVFSAVEKHAVAFVLQNQDRASDREMDGTQISSSAGIEWCLCIIDSRTKKKEG